MSIHPPGTLVTVLAACTAGDAFAEVVLTPPVAYHVGSFACGGAIGDLDGDGRPDLATADSSDETITVRLNLGGGVFGPAMTLPSPSDNPRDVEIVDVTGDELPDVAVAFRGQGSELAIFPGRGDGTFDAPLLYPNDQGFGFAFSMDAADLDLDGDQDLVIASAAVGDAVAVVYRNDDNQGFTITGAFLIGSDQIIYVADLAIADVDGDGFPDVIGAADNPREVVLLRGLGDATLGPREVLPFGEFFPLAVAVGELNGDGHPDVAAIGRELGQDRLVTALNDGSGSFAIADEVLEEGVLTHSFTTPAALELRDLDGDGIDEVIVQGAVAAGLGGGQLGPLASYGVGEDVLAVAAGNLDGDCDEDFVALQLDASFDSSAQVIVNVSPRPGDLDGDGSVATSDLLALLALWGPCAGCDADLDGDGAVGTADLLALLAAWGPCS